MGSKPPLFAYYNDCIFCSEKLPSPSDRTGDGEHVFPKNVYGFWKSRDICPECIKYFGDKVDNLALKNPAILTAMTKLNLPKANSAWENLPYVSTDTISGREIRGIIRGDEFRNKITDSDRFFECPEDLLKTVGRKWLQERTAANGNNHLEVDKLLEDYQNIHPGETVNSQKLGWSMRKLQLAEVRIDSKRLPPISPLVAKICTIFLCYIFDKDRLAHCSDFLELRDHARSNKPVRDYFFNWCATDERGYEKGHFVEVSFGLSSLRLVVCFFNRLAWEVILNVPQELCVIPENGAVSTIRFVLEFSDLQYRQVGVGLLLKGEEHFRPL